MKKTIKGLVRQNLMELRDSLMNYLKGKFPNTPEYIIQDFYYNALKTSSSEQVKEFIEEFQHYEWKLEKNLTITLDIFDDWTIKHLKERDGGLKNPHGVSNDTKRHETQKDLIQKKGLPTEPIICIYQDGKYELVEGWHRTIQLLNMYPSGYAYPNVYVGYRNE